MTPSLSQMPGYRVAEYTIILNPHEDLRERIMHLKKDFGEHHQANGAIGGKPYITLAKFTVWEMMEEKIMSSLKITAMAMPALKIHLKDFGSLPSHTIYIDVQSKQAIQSIVRELQTSRRLMKTPGYEPFFNNDPFIPIARKLSSEQYDKAWLEYSHRHFTSAFIADAMLVLKRREGDRGYQIIQRFEFMNLPIAIRQGQLF